MCICVKNSFFVKIFGNRNQQQNIIVDSISYPVSISLLKTIFVSLYQSLLQRTDIVASSKQDDFKMYVQPSEALKGDAFEGNMT